MDKTQIIYKINKLGVCSKCGQAKKKRPYPVRTMARSESFRNLYSLEDFIIELLTYCTIKQKVYHPHIPNLIMTFVPIYTWINPDYEHNNEDEMKVNLSHCNSVVSNDHRKLGVVLGSELDPRLDHVINVQLLDGVEFGIGICDETQINADTMRDFMCMKGGYGYYNYKKESSRMKLKSPPGFYWKIRACRKIRNEADICQTGDVLTMVIQRQNKKPSHQNPMLNLKATDKYTLSFYKNGEDMGFHLRNLKGRFNICLNYYFSSSKLKLLSDYNFRRHHQQWIRSQLQGSACQKRSRSRKSPHVRLQLAERTMVADVV